jgi:hypothetical protein
VFFIAVSVVTVNNLLSDGGRATFLVIPSYRERSVSFITISLYILLKYNLCWGLGLEARV